MDHDGKRDKKPERLELRPGNLDRQLTVITRPKPNFKKVEKSSVLGKVKAFMPTIQKAEVDLWKEMKLKVLKIHLHCKGLTQKIFKKIYIYKQKNNC